MTDIHVLLPDFATDRYAALVAGLETHRIGLSELLTLDAAEMGRRTRLPLLDLQLFAREVREHLAARVCAARVPALPAPPAPPAPPAASSVSPSPPRIISTLDDGLDAALGGGFATGQLAEVVGESGVGKTQLLLSLLLSVQLPDGDGDSGKRALYIATEAPLATGRLAQMARTHPRLQGTPAATYLANIATINTPDLEAQEHILMHQLPVQLDKASGAFGLVVIDSVAANFRPFFGGRGGSGGGSGGGNGSETLAARSLELARLGMLLRTLAQKHNLAIVVANQVADRFDRGEGLLHASHRWGGAEGGATPTLSTLSSQPPPPAAKRPRQDTDAPFAEDSQSQPPPLPPPPASSQPLPSHPYSSQLPPRSQMPFSQMLPPSSQQSAPLAPPVLFLDHQQRWFTGWGDDEPPTGAYRSPRAHHYKTPALGLVWATQLAVRVALVKQPRPGDGWVDDAPNARTGVIGAPRLRQSWRRWLKVVFAPQAAAADAVEYEIVMSGLRSIKKT